ncbi:MAG: hypothetical protein JRH18_24265 [Deltaproteobacteria bacterium]|nr:hypothetical protein [Deltaproteobacteria bacterium]MBW1995426.1 hypothetical protein [Deltaproteobacteria bacterium]MBW2154763.1 hypothetical protein [Deltaproteobacteria bacterium]
MVELRKDSDFYEISRYVYDFFSKYGFMDGDMLLDDEKEIVKHLCCRLTKAMGTINGRWEPHVMSTCTHNPYYIIFKDLQTNNYVSFYDMEEQHRRKIKERIEEIISSA